ncbi:MAG: hypothetical protein QOD90_527 [Mycobacterium sp.]|nr:hypothetical protein [Mycobacterium sp.]
MHLKRATCASAIIIGVGLSTLTAGAGLAAAQPGGPPCGPNVPCQGQGQGGPGGPRGGGPGGPPPQQQQGDRGGPGGPGGPGDRGGPGGPDDHGGPGGPDDHGGPGDRGGPGGPQWGGPDPRGGPDYHGGPGGPEWGPPPPDLGWRGIDQGRFDHQPFNYNGNWVQPIFNQDYNNWGFWFFGIWIPL